MDRGGADHRPLVGSQLRRGARWGAALVVALLLFLALPVARFEVPYSDVVLARDGSVLSARVATDEQWRFPPVDQVPERYALALTAFEDKRFWAHPGVDPLAMSRALWDNLRHRRVVSGASTLTMQTIRLARGNPPRTVGEKLWEALLALRLERRFSKAEVLAMYASHAPFGGNTVGLEAASQRYFQRPAAELSWAEAATLAVLPHSPGLVHPGRGRAELQAKRDRVLDRLVTRGQLSEQDAELAKLEPLPRQPGPVPRHAPHLVQRFAGKGATPTTVDLALQQQANAIVARHAARWAGNQVHNLAALMVSTDTGHVLAYVGNVPGLTGNHGQHVDIVQAPRSTGSLLKPLLYAHMIAAGELLPTQLVPDVPMRMGGFAPENFDRLFEGAIPADEALARSRNVPAVWMLQKHGVERFYRELQGFGLTTLVRPPGDYGLSLVLGGAEGSLWEMVGAYRQLGWQAHPRPTWQPLSLTGDAEESEAPPGRLAATAAWRTLEALVEVKRPGVLGAWRSFASSRPVAWKTGTSFGFRDAWAIGTTPDVTIGVWVGNADGEGRPELVGLRAAAPVLFDLLDAMPPGPWFDPPEGLASVEVCAHSGLLAAPIARAPSGSTCRRLVSGRTAAPTAGACIVRSPLARRGCMPIAQRRTPCTIGLGSHCPPRRRSIMRAESPDTVPFLPGSPDASQRRTPSSWASSIPSPGPGFMCPSSLTGVPAAWCCRGLT